MASDDQDVAVDVRELGSDAKLFNKLLAVRQEVVGELKKLEGTKREYTDKLLEVLSRYGYKTVLTPEWRATFTQGTSTRISKEKLLELGVSAKIIAQATVSTTYETLTVTPAKH